MKNPTIPNDRDTKENWERLARMAIAAMELGIRIEQDSGHRWIFTDKTADHYQPEIDPDVNEKLRAKQYGSFMDALENINTCLLQASFPSLIEMSENIDYDYDLTTFLGSPDMESKMSSGAGPDKRMRFEVAMAEVAQSQLRARYYEQRISTGAWRERIGKVFRSSSYREIALTEDEILRDEVQTMNRHIQIAEDCLESAKGLLPD